MVIGRQLPELAGAGARSRTTEQYRLCRPRQCANGKAKAEGAPPPVPLRKARGNGAGPFAGLPMPALRRQRQSPFAESEDNREKSGIAEAVRRRPFAR